MGGTIVAIDGGGGGSGADGGADRDAVMLFVDIYIMEWRG